MGMGLSYPRKWSLEKTPSSPDLTLFCCYSDADFNDIFAANTGAQQSGNNPDDPGSPTNQNPVSPAAMAYLDEQSILEQLRRLQREEDSGLIQGLTGLAENMGITTGMFSGIVNRFLIKWGTWAIAG